MALQAWLWVSVKEWLVWTWALTIDQIKSAIETLKAQIWTRIARHAILTTIHTLITWYVFVLGAWEADIISKSEAIWTCITHSRLWTCSTWLMACLTSLRLSIQKLCIKTGARSISIQCESVFTSGALVGTCGALKAVISTKSARVTFDVLVWSTL